MATWDPEGSFLVIGDSLGTVHFLDAVTKALVFSQEISRPNEVHIDEGEDDDGHSSSSLSSAGATRMFVSICFALVFNHQQTNKQHE